jgi:hypothetical protein
MNVSNRVSVLAFRPPARAAGRLRAAPEAHPSFRSTPMVVVALDAVGAAGVEAFRREHATLPAAGRRPVGVAAPHDLAPPAVAPTLEAAMAEALAGLPLDPSRRIGMRWEVVLVSELGPPISDVVALLRHAAAHSRWSLRVTWLVEASALCRPWSDPAAAGSWEAVAAGLRELAGGIERPGLAWNGAYLAGSVNRFGCVSTEGFTPLYLGRLLTALAASDLPDWLGTLPAAEEGGPDGTRVSAIGVSSFWHPPLPWREQAVAVQAHRRARAYASYRRLAPPLAFNRWLVSEVDRERQTGALEDRLLGSLLGYLEGLPGDPGGQCREMVARVAERAVRCIEPLRPAIDQAGESLFAELQRRLAAVGQELMLRGGTAAFGDTLAGLDGRLAALRDAAEQHQARVRELVRIDGRLLADLMAEANGRAIGLGRQRPAFFLRWWQNRRRRRWLDRTARALFQVLRGEVLLDIDAILLGFVERAGGLLDRLRAGLRRFRADLEGAGRDWLGQARRAFAPPLPMDVAGVPFAAVERWVEDLFDPVAEPPAEPLADGAPWHEWDSAYLAAALHDRAEDDAGAVRGGFAEGVQACGQVADAAQRTALARLSQPLVPIPGCVYDAHPQHVFQRWLVPGEQHGGEALADGAAVPCGLPWPTVVTVYRDLPLAALVGGSPCS